MATNYPTPSSGKLADKKNKTAIRLARGLKKLSFVSFPITDLKTYGWALAQHVYYTTAVYTSKYAVVSYCLSTDLSLPVDTASIFYITYHTFNKDDIWNTSQCVSAGERRAERKEGTLVLSCALFVGESLLPCAPVEGATEEH